ncbi:hypothetical protein LY90DRAFT_509702 [Neocallimastix californiae]|jgi:ABC-type multidrug transport system ATPase subunit|uniref:ABC transporter domain-containing protein n=1 Tax=Neocallimastix californiae TaxID=1754190 RepID=A0A1Y2CD76_9FUNG|nr:hypothetical protein LY90DRAFT_509702 [Neocallimastix californiae]|eukprot:ORY44265.1 hypothetical protein LY90DRAFT_509702 [Neocallimastix californiae]
MFFHQLRTLLWRNTVLKRRSVFSTILEIIIPTIIIYIIAKNSKYKDVVEEYEDIDDNQQINKFDEFPSNEYSEIYYNFYFAFPSEFDKNKQDLFIENFKNSVYLSHFTLIDSNKNFTYQNEIENNNNQLLDIDFVKRANDSILFENDVEGQDNPIGDLPPENNDIDNLDVRQIYEMKIHIFNSEYEMLESCKDYLNDDYYSTKYYAIAFSSLSKYTIHFDNHNMELHEYLMNNSPVFDSSHIDDLYRIQYMIDKALIKILSPNAQEIKVNYKIMAKKGYSLKLKENQVEDFVPFFMLFYFVPCISSLLTNLVIEKETRIKESLIIIGLRKSTFWLSWAVTYGIIIIISSIIVSFAMYYFKLFIFIHWSILIIVMLLYGLSCCCISFVLSTLIKKSKTANTIGVMIIVAFFAIYFVNRGLERKPKAHLICTFTISPISFLSIFNYLIQLEKQKLTVTFLNMLKNKLLRNYFLGLVTSLIAYFIIAIYLDNVLPQGNNFHRKWHFIITDLFRRNKKKKISTTDPDSNSSSPFIQKDPEGLSKAVEIKNVGKSFKVKRENIEILKNIDFNAYYDEIFAILGHNGAGKTTLISIMTGILSASHGEVYYDDVPITDNETEICRQFGYCPQFDTFNNSLTLAEHVRLFAGIKNVNVNIDEILRDIDLLDKKDNYPKQLSGGQRRKLCITLALLGSPKYVFLDEPTTGLDPYSRKNIWELLSQKKKGRVMFVTTHYMDEADLLADRKMIISNGNISCLGTSLFLKNRFNMNYSLDIHVEDPKDCLLIDEFIEKCCPGSLQNKGISNTNIHVHLENDSNHSNAELKEDYLVTYLLPMKYSESFKTIFERLNYLIKDGRNSIKNFSLTAPTLEELFIKLESNTNETGDESQKGKGFAAVDMDKDSSKLIDQLNPVFGKTNFNHSSSLQQILSIMKLRFKIFIRNKTFALLYTLIPVCLIILCIYFENMIIKQMDEPVQFKALDIQPSIYEDVQWFKDSTSTGQAAEIVNKIGAHSKISIQSLNYEKELSFSSNKLRGDMKYIGGFDGKDVQQTPEFLIYTNMTYNYAIPIAINLLSNAVLEQNQINRQISVTYKPLDYYPNQLYTENDENNQFNIMPELAKLILEPILIVAMAIAISLSISIFGPLTVKEREEGITHQLFLNGTKRINYWIGVLLSDAICILVPMMFIAITGIFNEISIFKTKVIGYTVIISITWALASLLHQYIASYFYKKYEKVSTLFIIVNPILSLLIGIYAIVIAVISSIDVNALVKDDKEVTDEVRKDGNFWQYKYYLVLVLFAPATIVLLYTKLTSYILIRKISITKEDILSFMLTEALDTMKRDDLSNKEKSKLLAKKFFDKKIPSFSELMKERGTNNFVILIAGMIVLILFYMIILYLFEKSKSRVLKKNTNYTPAERQILDKKLETGPKDVLNEWKRVGYSLNGDNNLSKKIALKVYQLNKDFKINMNEVRKKRKENANANANNNGDYNNNNGKKSAFQKMDNRIIYDKKKNKHINRIVDDVTFGVDVGECLGLLGPNGAGKTTSISMITGLLSHTHGTVVYGDKDISQTDMPDLSLGYCSQHDSLWKLLTVKETIQFYLNICGYPRKDIPRYTKALAEACGIEIHLNKKVSEISGGTKRKLSLIVAICSSPNYLILDEPSAGMDPFTRRYMWKLISELKKVRETATILTTHSTEEAEALCDRIAILIKGRLVCVDSPKSIKMNHSHSYILEVFTDRPEEFEEVYVRGQNIFGLASNENYQLESSISYQKYSVQMKTENIANVFSVMEQAKKAGIISQYNFGQYSLEQVFINFVNNVE